MFIFVLVLTLSKLLNTCESTESPNGYHQPTEDEQFSGNQQMYQIKDTDEPDIHVQYTGGLNDELSCDETHSAMEINLRSVNYPAYYDNNLNCTYTIRKASVDVCELEFTILNFDIENGPLCNYDYLSINDERICGSIPVNTTNSVPFNGSEMVLRFHSNDQVAGMGFHILIRQKTNCLPFYTPRIVGQNNCNCNEEKSSEFFFIKSPNYPATYSNNMDCIYKIRKFSPNVCRLELTFITFALENSTNCTYDYIEINKTRYCGKNAGHLLWLKFDQTEITIQFHSDTTVSNLGFYIAGRQLQTTCSTDSIFRIGQNYCNEEKHPKYSSSRVQIFQPNTILTRIALTEFGNFRQKFAKSGSLSLTSNWKNSHYAVMIILKCMEKDIVVQVPVVSSGLSSTSQKSILHSIQILTKHSVAFSLLDISQ